MAVQIPLKHGAVALIDEEDAERVLQRRWYAMRIGGNSYVASGYKSDRVLLHRFVLDAPADVFVDHRNGVRSDNRRCNLRLCTHPENMRNRKAPSHSKTGVKGVAQHGGRFRARIVVDGKQRVIGSFETLEQAARAYDAAATRHFGEFARLNYPVA